MKVIGLIALLVATATALPSVDSARLDTRDDKVTTSVKLGKHTIRYGTIDPQDVMKSLKKACTGGICDTTPYELDTLLAKGPAKLKLTAEGVVDENDLDLFVNAMAAAVSKGTKTEKQTWCTEGFTTLQPVSCNTLTINKQASFVGITRRRADHSVDGFMAVTIELEIADDKWCKVVLSLGNVIVGQINGIASGLLGQVIVPVCSESADKN